LRWHPGISRGKPLARRPAGNKLLAATKQSKPLVIVSKLDRVFRGPYVGSTKRILYAAEIDRTVTIWDATTGKVIRTLAYQLLGAPSPPTIQRPSRNWSSRRLVGLFTLVA
jgi:hypothetical protein